MEIKITNCDNSIESKWTGQKFIFEIALTFCESKTVGYFGVSGRGLGSKSEGMHAFLGMEPTPVFCFCALVLMFLFSVEARCSYYETVENFK